MRIPSHWLVIVCGLTALWLLRYLPPDMSLHIVKEQGVLTVCHPANLAPYIRYDKASGEAFGIEAELVKQVAEALDVRVHWNVQYDWYKSIDPTAWGIRKGACELLIGGIAYTSASKGFFVLSEPHHLSKWAWVGHSLPEKRDDVGFWAPYLGLEQQRFAAADYLDERRLYPYFLADPEEAIRKLQSQDVSAVLTDAHTAAWIQGQTGLELWLVDDLRPFAFSLAMWKGGVTLRRAVNQALEDL